MVKQLFRGLTFWQTAEYVLLFLLVFSIPFSWELSRYVLLVLVLNTVLKLAVERQTRLKTHSKIFILTFSAFLLLFLCYVVSLMYSSNHTIGNETVVKKLPFVFFALFFMFTNLEYLSRLHLRVLLYTLTFAVVIKFLVSYCPAFYEYFFNDMPVRRLFGSEWIGMHYAYMSMYVVLALAFIYTELFKYFRSMKVVLKILLIICALILLFFVALMRSRAGILSTCLLIVIVIIHLTIVKKNFFVGMVALAVALVVALSINKVLPNAKDRIVETIESFKEGNKEDARIFIARCSLRVIKNNPVLGVGVGDVVDELSVYYNAEGHEGAAAAECNSHNQFLDAYVGGGILCFLMQLSIIVLPIVAMIKRKRYSFMFLVFLFIIGFNALFESILERQMGIIFFNLFYGLFFLFYERGDASTRDSLSKA